jgi:hypothetical protein
MTARQFASSRSVAGAGAEIITISHCPTGPGEGPEAHLALPDGPQMLPSALIETLVEDLFDSWERMMAMQVFVCRVAQEVSSFSFLHYDRSRTKDQVFAPTTASPMSAAALYGTRRSTEPRRLFPRIDLPFQVVRSGFRPCVPINAPSLIAGNAASEGPAQRHAPRRRPRVEPSFVRDAVPPSSRSPRAANVVVRRMVRVTATGSSLV